MTKRVVNRDWLEPDYVPRNLFETPFVGVTKTPEFAEVLDACTKRGQRYQGSVEAFAADLLAAVEAELEVITTPNTHHLLSGGYDSRIIAYILEKKLKQRVIYVGDGAEEPAWSATLDHLGVPERRRYVHDTSRHDPYGLVGASCRGFAPLYTQLRFTPPGTHSRVTLTTGLGGGEWFSYPASRWHDGKWQRIIHTDVVATWMDCWPQYTLIPGAWGRGYGRMISPYCTPRYARVAQLCRDEWLVETDPDRELDLVRQTMMSLLDDQLEWLGYQPHVYDWNLSQEQKGRIDGRYDGTAKWEHRSEWGMPSEMHKANHACTLAGFATWIELLEAEGVEVVV